MLASDIKAKIKLKLDALVTAGTLKEVHEDDLKVGILDRDIAKYPAAILTAPSIEGSVFTNVENVRTHIFTVVVIQKADNISSVAEIEDLAETIMDAFDGDQTLGGLATAGVEPSVTLPEPVTSRGKAMIAFGLKLKVKAIKQI